MQLFFTSLAESDLDDILTFIAQHRQKTAREVVKRLRSACELIASQPLIGERRSEFPGDLRSFVVERWVVFYQVAEGSVRICPVLDGARDIESILD